MAEEPRNAASERARRFLELLNDQGQVMSGALRSLAAPGFASIDHRRLTLRPSDEVDRFPGDIEAYESLTGEWPSFTVQKVLAVRGDRLVALVGRVAFGEIGERDFILVELSDQPVTRVEVTHIFDPEDLDEALALLDRVHAELGGD